MGLVAAEMVARFAGESEQRVTAMVADRIARAYLLEGEARMMAFEFNARLVTELRRGGIWPDQYAEPRCTA